MKRIIAFVVILGVEIISYLKIRPNDKESFFVIWAIVGVFMLFGKFINLSSANIRPNSSAGLSNAASYRGLAGAYSEKLANGEDSQIAKYKTIRMFSSTSFIYIFLIVVNVSSFAIVHFTK